MRLGFRSAFVDGQTSLMTDILREELNANGLSFFMAVGK